MTDLLWGATDVFVEEIVRHVMAQDKAIRDETAQGVIPQVDASAAGGSHSKTEQTIKYGPDDIEKKGEARSRPDRPHIPARGRKKNPAAVTPLRLNSPPKDWQRHTRYKRHRRQSNSTAHPKAPPQAIFLWQFVTGKPTGIADFRDDETGQHPQPEEAEVHDINHKASGRKPSGRAVVPHIETRNIPSPTIQSKDADTYQPRTQSYPRGPNRGEPIADSELKG